MVDTTEAVIDSIVTRTLHVDYIYFDLIFLTICIIVLMKKRYWIPIIWGIIGWLVYLFVDYYLWYTVMESRTYEGSIPPSIFFQWFCFSPGFAQFSYVAVMFEKRSWAQIWKWTVFFFVGWILIGLASQWIPFNDEILRVSRNMHANNQRLTFTIMTIGNVVIASILCFTKKWKWEHMFYLLIVGTLVELNLELSLSVSGIRLEQGTWSWELFIVNTLIEFNMGIVLMFLLWVLAVCGPRRFFQPTLRWRDFPHIKTDFNWIYSMCQVHGVGSSETATETHTATGLTGTEYLKSLHQDARNWHRYPEQAILQDISYFTGTYSDSHCKFIPVIKDETDK
ncbi:MAG: hypothetical protein E4G98_01000 [Promethearchaeota archaeon]|nr:MAG: hypothetical protein E4G98_01000 [Candidatus Lokiarchaeota archaeon]